MKRDNKEIILNSIKQSGNFSISKMHLQKTFNVGKFIFFLFHETEFFEKKVKRNFCVTQNKREKRN